MQDKQKERTNGKLSRRQRAPVGVCDVPSTTSDTASLEKEEYAGQGRPLTLTLSDYDRGTLGFVDFMAPAGDGEQVCREMVQLAARHGRRHAARCLERLAAWCEGDEKAGSPASGTRPTSRRRNASRAEKVHRNGQNAKGRKPVGVR
jgi:hypothetical protein